MRGRWCRRGGAASRPSSPAPISCRQQYSTLNLPLGVYGQIRTVKKPSKSLTKPLQGQPDGVHKLAGWHREPCSRNLAAGSYVCQTTNLSAAIPASLPARGGPRHNRAAQQKGPQRRHSPALASNRCDTVVHSTSGQAYAPMRSRGVAPLHRVDQGLPWYSVGHRPAAPDRARPAPGSRRLPRSKLAVRASARGACCLQRHKGGCEACAPALADAGAPRRWVARRGGVPHKCRELASPLQSSPFTHKRAPVSHHAGTRR